MSIERVERKNGVVVWRVRWRQAGQNRSKVLGRKRDAEAFDAELRRKRRTGELAALDAGNETLAEFGEEWWKLYAEPNLAATTLKVYAILWDTHVLPRLGSLRLREITPSVITRFRLELEAEGVGRVSIHKAMTLLQGVLQRACEWDRLASNPARAVRKPSAARARAVEPLTPNAVETIRTWLLERELLRDATLVSVLAYAGLRPGEALALTWSHVRGRTLLVEAAVSVGAVGQTKTRRRRTVRLLPPLGADLAEWRLRAGRPPDEALVFPGHDGRPVVAGDLQELAPADLQTRQRRCGPRPLAPVRPAPLVRLATDRRGPQRRRGRSPGGPLAEDGARHLRTRLRGARPDAARRCRRTHPRRPRGAAQARATADPVRRRMTVAVDELPASYAAVHRYNGAVLQHDAREQIVPMAIQPRDFAIVLDVWRYKFLTAPMVHELHWNGGSMWPAQRRLQKMFNAGLLERFRPVSLRGSYPWTYHLGERGHVILRDSQVVDTGWRYRAQVVHEFGHVLHDLQLNAWVIAYRRQPHVRFVSWEGERTIEPPPTTRDERAEPRWLPGGGWTVHGLRDFRHRPVRPDAVIELGRGDWEVPHTLLIEFDRTRRVDKNFEKFRRYDTFLVWWWNLMEEALHASEPYVIFVCQDEDQLDQFLHAADFELTGHHDCLDYNRDRFVGRNRILFAVERDMHAGRLDAWRVPAVRRGHLNREKHSHVRSVALTVGS